jgi:hypothetical protein
MQFGMLRMVRKLEHVSLTGDGAGSLSEGSSGNKKEQREECDFHSIFPD